MEKIFSAMPCGKGPLLCDPLQTNKDGYENAGNLGCWWILAATSGIVYIGIFVEAVLVFMYGGLVVYIWRKYENNEKKKQILTISTLALSTEILFIVANSCTFVWLRPFRLAEYSLNSDSSSDLIV